jgi:hypothetical protein
MNDSPIGIVKKQQTFKVCYKRETIRRGDNIEIKIMGFVFLS